MPSSRKLAIALAMCLALSVGGTFAAAQVTIQPKAEVYVGYSWLGVSGYADFDHKVNDISEGFDASITYYLPQAHNLGFIFDGSGHFATSAPNYTGIGFAFAGLQYKYHTNSFSPFFRLMAGAANLSPAFPPTPPNFGNQWNAALDAGGGFDYAIGRRFSLRVAQADYIYTNYSPYIGGNIHSTQWNNVRLSAGVIFNLGSYYVPQPTAACTVQPSEVIEGEPVTVTATGSNFNPKHTVMYSWTTNGGKLNSTDKASAQIDTTGVAAGSYTATASLTDPKINRHLDAGEHSFIGTPDPIKPATCTAAYTVKAKPANPPQVTCSVNPSTVQGGGAVTVTTTANSPDSSPISSYNYTSSAGKISGNGTTATLDTAGLPAGPVTITVAATDARNLTGSGTCSVSVEVPPPPPTCSKVNSIQFPDLKRPWRVDNTAKAILDDVASRLKADPNAKIVIVGYADGEKAPMEGTGKKRHKMNLAAQRAVNAKAYLVQQQGIDPSRVEVRQGTGQQKVADIIWVPQGADENACADLQNTTPVDESMVKPSENAYPKPKKAAAPMHHHKKGAAAPAAAPQQ